MSLRTAPAAASRAAEPKPIRPIARPRLQARAFETYEKPPQRRAAATRGRHIKVQMLWVEAAPEITEVRDREGQASGIRLSHGRSVLMPECPSPNPET